MVRALGVIPARFASTRFPGKPLASLGDRTLIERVFARVTAATRLERVIVATDDPRIADVCRSSGAEVRLTSADHASGTDRVAEVVRDMRDAASSYDVVVNVQGDEPFVTPTSLDRLVCALEDDDTIEIATLFEPVERLEELFDRNVVKVVTDLRGRALYFSRSPIPYWAGDPSAPDLRSALGARPGGLDGFLKHQGVYAYRTSALLALTSMPPSPLERDESLEQLRALQAGLAIRVLRSDFRSVGVDTPADLERAVALLGESQA
jgi:3-deoxy-manno-octulosonate cytidylyltransferase (CMP-KDO synthetase)